MNSKINYMKKIGENATTASSEICNLKTEKKNSVLNAYNKNLKRFKKEIVLQNNKDVKAAINKKKTTILPPQPRTQAKSYFK